jgi:hypothetical protein
MRRLLLCALVLVLATPAAAWALQRAPGDGTLSVARADDYVALNIRGAVLGRTSGYIEILEPRDGDCSAESVFGSIRPREFEDRQGRLVCRYFGASIRFRLVGGRQWVRVYGPDISISAVGRGDVWLRNTDEDRVGTYSMDGERAASLPVRLTRLTLGLPLPSGGSG